MTEEKNKTTLRILVGDDNESLERALARALSLNGFETDSASTPQETIAKARANDYFAVITDLEYTDGGREGYEVLRQIRDSPTHKILYTAQSGFEFAAEGFAEGADYVILRKKHSELIELLNKLRGERK